MNQNPIDNYLEQEKAAIQQCENEVIRDIPYIQAFGYLLACDPKEGIISHASENVTEWFQQPVDTILGASIYDLFPSTIAHQCKNAAGHSTITRQREHIGRLDDKDTPHDIFVHKKKGKLIIELQAANAQRLSGLTMLYSVQRTLERLGSIHSVQALMESAVDELRALTGFHRVKAYRFLSDGAGEVIAESREPQVDSFLGLRFPAYDVPQAARALYINTPIRIIPSVSAQQIPIIAANTKEEALDLSLALFRGVVPVHILYLQNMGVQGSLSLPIIINGEMWGLFACHHMNEYMLSSEVITAVEILGSTMAMLLNTILQRQQLARMEECTRLVNTLFVADESALGFSAYWDTASPELATLIDCDGVGLLSDSRFDQYGACLPTESVKQLARYLDEKYQQQKSEPTPIALDAISEKYPALECGDIAGVLAIPNPVVSYRYLLFFRKKACQLIRWAGAPSKDIQRAEDGFRLNPRTSFAEYIDSTQKRSEAFDNDDLIVGQALKEALSKMMSAVSTHSQHRERLGLVIRELNHRVRNILALVGSIISQSRSTSHDTESFVLSLEHRIQALSETHKLLTEFDWKPIHIQLLFERALVPYRAYLKTRIVLSGVDVSLPPELASLFALIVHELASNAAKYGALSNAAGRIKLNWQADHENLIVHWLEEGGVPVEEPKCQGFGMTLIKEALAYEFDAQCHLAFLQTGIKVRFVIPRKNTNITIERAVTQDAIALEPAKSFAVLVLEDDYFISKETLRMLEGLGATRIDVAPTIARAEECIARTRYNFALLDANIRGEFSGKIAGQLQQQGVPFAFATGYDSKDQELRATACIDVLSKPINETQLLAVLKQASVM
ncbi:MAG: GAF domain-containing protein [Cellvibrionaceae bacterium]|nr:GAF domain-containing protein [Cellvibrionaceae bacterium]